MFEWLLQNAEALVAIVALSGTAAAIATPVIHLFFRSKHQIEQLSELLSPSDGGPGLRAVLGTLSSGVEVLVKDVKTVKTSQELQELGMQRLMARMRASLQDETAPVFESDARGNYIFANRAYLELTGRTADDILGRGWEVSIHREDRNSVVADWNAAVAAQRLFESEFRVSVRGTNKLYRVKCTAQPLQCEKGNISGYIGRYVRVEPA